MSLLDNIVNLDVRPTVKTAGLFDLLGRIGEQEAAESPQVASKKVILPTDVQPFSPTDPGILEAASRREEVAKLRESAKNNLRPDDSAGESLLQEVTNRGTPKEPPARNPTELAKETRENILAKQEAAEKPPVVDKQIKTDISSSKQTPHILPEGVTPQTSDQKAKAENTVTAEKGKGNFDNLVTPPGSSERTGNNPVLDSKQLPKNTSNQPVRIADFSGNPQLIADDQASVLNGANNKAPTAPSTEKAVTQAAEKAVTNAGTEGAQAAAKGVKGKWGTKAAIGGGIASLLGLTGYGGYKGLSSLNDIKASLAKLTEDKTGDWLKDHGGLLAGGGIGLAILMMLLGMNRGR